VTVSRRPPGRASDIPELWSVAQAAAHWGVTESRARAILASRGIKRVSGYPADKIKAVTLRQGARTDLLAERLNVLLANSPGGGERYGHEKILNRGATVSEEYRSHLIAQAATADRWVPKTEDEPPGDANSERAPGIPTSTPPDAERVAELLRQVVAELQATFAITLSLVALGLLAEPALGETRRTAPMNDPPGPSAHV
jgi:hypothetical protein